MKALLDSLPLLIFVIVLTGLLLAWVTSPIDIRPIEAGAEADAGRLRADVEALTGLDGFRCFERPEDLEGAARWVKDRLGATGLPIEEQSYGVGDRNFRFFAAHYGEQEGPVLVVGAHYDVCGEQPGADDNASGVAGLLELAGLLAANRPEVRHRIELALWPLEEPPNFGTPAMGSAVHAKSLAARGEQVGGMICLEMIGFFSDENGSQGYPLPGMSVVYGSTGDFISVVGNPSSWWFTRRVKMRMAGATDLPVRSINAPSALAGLDLSDHLNFWRQGWDAVMITDTAFNRNPNYHEPTDTPDTLDYNRMADVVTGVYAAITTL